MILFRNAIVPVWSAETSHHTSRGKMIAMEFTLNILGVVVAVSFYFNNNIKVLYILNRYIYYSIGSPMVYLLQKAVSVGDFQSPFN